jgi:hypothetical protein
MIESLSTKKGTVISIKIITTNGQYIIDTLLISAAGLIIDTDLFRYYFSNNEVLQSRTLYLLDNQAKLIKSRECKVNEALLGIQTTVLYPDGSTWTESINIIALGLIIWDETLLRTMNAQVGLEVFGNPDWRKNPSMALFYKMGQQIDFTRPVNMDEVRESMMLNCRVDFHQLPRITNDPDILPTDRF